MSSDFQFELAENFHGMKQIMHRLAEKTGIPHSEFCLMCVISDCGSEKGISVSQIAAELEVTPPAVSRTLKSLDERGLIERRVNALNRRSTMVKLTDRGRKFLEAANNRLIGMISCINEKMGAERVTDFNTMFGEILGIMSEYINNSKEKCTDDKNA